MSFKVSTGPVLVKDAEKALDALEHGVKHSFTKLNAKGGSTSVEVKDHPSVVHADKVFDAARNAAMELLDDCEDGAVNVTIEHIGQTVSVSVTSVDESLVSKEEPEAEEPEAPVETPAEEPEAPPATE